MASVLSVFSSALFFLLPVFSLLGFSQCKLTRRDLASVIGLMIFGLLGAVLGVLGILAMARASGLRAILNGFCGLTTNALLAGSIYKSNQNRERSIVPNVNLAVYAVLMSLLVICGTVLSLLQKPSSLLGPLFHLLFATAALPLLVYTFLATVPDSNPNDNDILSYAEDVAPATPNTPRKFQSHLTLPLSPSFLSFSSPPPSPCSNRTFSSSVYPESRSTKTKKCTSLDLPSTHPHSIQLKHGTNTEFGAKKSCCSTCYSSDLFQREED
ncbi:hypothetical protein BT96DRAFT_671398 [Gymnopus androsaceus JB14]|uniref:Uncharacterized protein n=1 Tax=Gymnopus androsaceus JB14 TaxID=1447944 RepID=A0A6A4IFK7_9AGAR|nr:hypothetical protein BT96DRAFT_671398 [Gymnopus androsaceus JB14]